MRKLFDLQHPFFRPLWIRLVTVAFCLGWAAVEFSQANTMWAMLFGGLGLFCAWEFFVAFDPRDPEPDTKTSAEDEEEDK